MSEAEAENRLGERLWLAALTGPLPTQLDFLRELNPRASRLRPQNLRLAGAVRGSKSGTGRDLGAGAAAEELGEKESESEECIVEGREECSSEREIR